MGIIIETNSHKHYFTRENWYNEFIYINVDKEFDDIYPINEDINDWISDKDDVINIERSINSINNRKSKQ